MRMPIEKGKISASQLMFAIICYLQGTTIVTSFYSSTTKQDSWIAMIGGFVISLIFIWMYSVILGRYPGKNLIEINEAVFGKIAGKVLSAFYVLFFILVASLNLNNVSDFVSIHLMPETPEFIFALLLIALCAFAVYYGVETVVRYGMTFFILWIIGLSLATGLSAFNMELGNFLPMLSLPVTDYLKGSFIASTFPFCSVFVFTMIAPYTDNQKLIGKAFFMGVLIAFIPLLIMTLRDIAVLGNMSSAVVLPSFETLRQINVIELFSRMEVIFAILRLVLMFFKIGILTYVACLSAAQLFGLNSYRPLIVIICALILIHASIVFDSPVEEINWGPTAAPLFNAFFEIFLPTVTLAVIKIKDRIKQAKEENR